MSKLKFLDASGTCGINDNGILGLNLKKLYVGNNPNITNVSRMTNLKILRANGNCGINNKGILGLNLEELFTTSF